MVEEYHIENNFIVVISLQLLLLFQNIFSCIFSFGREQASDLMA